jgi:hypothetical protein
MVSFWWDKLDAQNLKLINSDVIAVMQEGGNSLGPAAATYE